MDNIRISQNICMEPKTLGPKFTEKLTENLRNNLVNLCDEKLGYILDIENNSIQIKSNIVSPTSSVLVSVTCCIKRILPQIGKKYTGNICMVIAQGIMVNISNVMKIFVPVKNLECFKFKQKHEESYFKKNKGMYLKNGDEITVEITTMRYEKRHFNCIGILSEKNEK